MRAAWQTFRSWVQQRLARWRRAPQVTGTVPPRLEGPSERTLVEPPRASVSVVIPALNEAARIASVVRHVLADPVTAEVIVVDDSSIDDTAALAREAGARVITSTLLGKGASMRDGLLAAKCEWVAYLDGDLAGLRDGLVTDLCRPLAQGDADFVKARFGRGGGRVTELTAKPMLKVFFPELAGFSQPLGGLIAAQASLLRSLHFEDGYGVDVGLLIDAHRAGARLVEADVGSLENDSQPLLDLAAMANEVSRVIYMRARAAGRLHVEQIAAMYETQRQATASLEYIITRRRGRTRLLLLDMDGTVTPHRFAVELANVTGQAQALHALLDQPGTDAGERTTAIASLFRFVHRQQFERVAHAMPLREGSIGCVNVLRRAGFMVGLVSDSYFVAAEIMRRRLFADFALAHTMHFDGDVCSGQVRINPAFLPVDGGDGAVPSKGHVVQRFRNDGAQPRVQEIWAVGDSLNDLGMLSLADRAFVIEPKSPRLALETDAVCIQSFDALERLARQVEQVGQAAAAP